MRGYSVIWPTSLVNVIVSPSRRSPSFCLKG
jgi:hypothetical protein